VKPGNLEMCSIRSPSARHKGMSWALLFTSVLLAGIWVASCISKLWYSDGKSWCIIVGGGALSVCWGEPAGWPDKFEYVPGFWWDTTCDDGVLVVPEAETIMAFHGMSVPLWPLLLVAAYLAIREVRRVSLQRRRRGHCKNCGYDLQGLPEPRCPECGSPFEQDC
jgi:hypothetical protein